MQAWSRRSSSRQSVCLSVCLSVRHTRVLWQNERKVLPTFLTRKVIRFSDTKNGWWGTPPSTWNCGANWLCRCKKGDFQSIFARSGSVLIHWSKKMSIKLIAVTLSSLNGFLKFFHWRIPQEICRSHHSLNTVSYTHLTLPTIYSV